EFNVQLAGPQLLLARRAAEEQVLLDDLAAGPLVGALAVEQDQRPRGRLGPQRRALALDALEDELAVRRFAADLVLGDVALPARGRAGRLARRGLRLDLGAALGVPAGPGQTARQEVDVEFALAQGHDLGPQFGAAELALVLALDMEVRPGLGGVGERVRILL